MDREMTERERTDAERTDEGDSAKIGPSGGGNPTQNDNPADENVDAEQPGTEDDEDR